MNLLSRVQQSFGFTHNEIKVILFLSLTFLIGLGVRWYKSVQTAPDVAQQFDYSETDKQFLEHSRKAAELFSESSREHPDEDSRKKQATLKPHGININTADKQQLMRLPGIGEEYAKRIIAYRDDNGPFSSAEDLINVMGIGKQRLDRLRPYITTGTHDH
jgi:competence ComEA-like helix-hairpin-helix protein